MTVVFGTPPRYWTLARGTDLHHEELERTSVALWWTKIQWAG